jgi:gamma-tubulin complex component 2
LLQIKEKLAAATQPNFQQSTIQSATFLRQSLNSSSGSVKSVKSIPYTQRDAISSWNFSFNDETILPLQMKIPKPIIGLPISAQERTIITELLNTLNGINGTLIVPKMRTINYDEEHFVRNSMPIYRINIVEFEMNEQIQESIRDILTDILPLANYYFQIQNFIEYSSAPESGQVLQALSHAVSKLITDYYGTIAQLEGMHIKQELNLQKVIFYLRPIIQTMETVTKVCNMLLAHNIRGGNVLTNLHDNIALFSGDKNSQQILIYLTQKAAEPYMEILKLWIYKGIIIDRRNEFFVEDNEKECRNPDENENYFDHFWEKRYVLRSEKVPRFLEKQADIIARTGKYLNVVRECGKRVVFNQAQSKIKFSHTDEQNYVNIISDAYTFASKALLELIMDDNDLMGHLLSVKRYFLLQQGDFIVQFMDACESEMMKKIDDIIPMRLENLLELTLRLSSAKHDKYQDNLCTTLFAFDICTQMSKIIQSGGEEDFDEDEVDYNRSRCIEHFVFDYNVQWPLSIVLNQLTMSKYQLIFRQLFYCKFVENYLCRVWIENKNAKKFDQKTAEQYRAAFTLRQRMLTAIQNLEYYMMVEVIEPVWHIFMQQMAKAKNIDDVLNHHEDFLDNCLKNCMLTHPDLLKKIVAVALECISFCVFIEVSFKNKKSTFSNKQPKCDFFSRNLKGKKCFKNPLINVHHCVF